MCSGKVSVLTHFQKISIQFSYRKYRFFEMGQGNNFSASTNIYIYIYLNRALNSVYLDTTQNSPQIWSWVLLPSMKHELLIQYERLWPSVRKHCKEKLAQTFPPEISQIELNILYLNVKKIIQLAVHSKQTKICVFLINT